jgi:hypothetical protein
MPVEQRVVVFGSLDVIDQPHEWSFEHIRFFVFSVKDQKGCFWGANNCAMGWLIAQ